MFELSVALKYLLPRWRQLSVSIISLISVLVIALVVWLIIVFFSVTHGLERVWTQKLIALTAPVRITPTEAYYNSYYYLVDGISANSDYTLKTLHEKFESPQTDPYDIYVDEEPPLEWPEADRDGNGELKDIVKKTYEAINQIQGVPGLTAHDFEMTMGNLKLHLVREANLDNELIHTYDQQMLSQGAYLGSFDSENPSLAQATLPISEEDLNNVLAMSQLTADESLKPVETERLRDRLHKFFNSVTINQLKTPSKGWVLPRRLLPKKGKLQVLTVWEGKQLNRVVIPGAPLPKSEIPSDVPVAQLNIATNTLTMGDGATHKLPKSVPLIVQGNWTLPVKLMTNSIDQAQDANQVRFNATFNLQRVSFEGEIPLGKLQIVQAKVAKNTKSSLWLTHEGTTYSLPTDPELGDGILLPKSFRDSGALVGDRGYVSYYTPTASSVQEQRIPVYVAGFYDPGIIPIGGKFVLANQEMTSLIRASHNQEDTQLSNGINVRFTDLSKAESVKEQLEKAFLADGIDQYWKVETYREYDFTKDLLQQLSSERNLWSLIAAVIIIVACSNIISMLIILVNDKRVEIGILRSMGATSRSIATIFGFCGMVMGLMGSVIGTLVAVVTLRNLKGLIDFISRVQGYEVFNPVFYGNTLPNEVSFEALAFVMAATVLTSLLAGIVPATKASMMRPSTILRSE